MNVFMKNCFYGKDQDQELSSYSQGLRNHRKEIIENISTTLLRGTKPLYSEAIFFLVFKIKGDSRHTAPCFIL